jgi:hypothetical protein
VAFVTTNLVAKRLDEVEPVDIDLMWVEIRLSGKKVIVGFGYRPPKQSRAVADIFLEQFRASLASVMALGSAAILIMGDFNDHCLKWDGSHEGSDLGNDFYELINMADMVQLVTEPTHITSRSKSLIDLIITDSPGYIKSIDLLPPLGSNHVTLYLELQITYPRDKNFTRHVWDYSKGDYNQLNQSIIDHEWDSIISDDTDINAKASIWTESFLRLCKTSIPNRNIKVKPRDLPWFTHECKCAIRNRDRLYKRFCRTRTPRNELIWKNKAREARVIINLARLNYRQNLMKTLGDPTLTAKKYWSLIKRVYGSKKGMGIPVLEVGNKLCSTSTDKANALTEFFGKQQTLLEPIGHQLPPLHMLTMQRLSLVETTPNEVRDILCSLDVGKAHGIDGVSVRLLKETSSSIDVPLCALINESFSCGKVPTSWKMANVSPVHKKNEKSKVDNYRPISLLSTLAKIQERIVYKRLYSFLMRNGLLTAKNSGFKEKDSAMCQLIKIVDNIYKALEDGKDINLVFLDVSKAFDKVWHRGLIHKLKSNGIDGPLLNWLEDYLRDRQIRVVINGQSAAWAKTNAGVPQGSVLGPLLFLVFINDVVNDIQTDINLFADDTSLINIIDELAEAYATTGQDLIKLATWADQWLVTFNAAKTVSLHITKSAVKPVLPTLKLKGTDIVNVETHCHLGVDIESAFTWQTHIKRIAEKGAKCVGLMRRASRDLPRECLEKLYTTMVRPILEYGGVLFDGSPDSHTEPLDKVQREAGLVCTGAYKHTKTVRLMEEVGWDSLGSRRARQRSTLMYKIQNHTAPPYLSEACPPLVGEVSHYNLRNADNITIPMGRRTGYVNSYFPSAVRLWNGLDRHIKQSESISSFKDKLKKVSGTKKVKLYSKFNGAKAINHTRMRLGLSGLKAQRFAYKHVDSPKCDYCGARREDPMHFFLQCNTYNRMRIKLMNNVKELYVTRNIVLDLRRTIIQKELVLHLLCGDPRLNDLENVKLFRMVQQFICDSKRF